MYCIFDALIPILCIGTPIPPWVVVPTDKVQLTINNYNYSMKCMPLSNHLDYFWEKRKDIFSLRTGGINSQTLTITNLRPEDSGEYRCTVSNSTGSITSNYIKITIEGKYIQYHQLCALKSCCKM